MENKITLRVRITEHLEKNYPRFLNGGEIEDWVRSISTFKASNASRTCRKLAEDGIIERKMEKGSVWYRYKTQELSTEIYSKEYIKMKEAKKQGVLI